MLKQFNSKLFLVTIFLLALVLRLSLIVYAHHGDLNNNISWGTVAYEHGLKGFYEGYAGTTQNIENWPYSAPNQPPLTIYMFTVSRFIWQNLRDFFWYMNWELQVFPSKLVWFWDEKGMDVLVKLPSILADLGIGIVIYKYFKNKSKQKIGIILASVFLFNPPIWYNSAVWGQTDSIVNLLGLIGIIALLNKKLVKFALFITFSLLFKPSLSIFTPVLITVAILQIHPVKRWLQATAYSLLSVFAISFSFHPNIDLFVWLFNLYKDRFIPGEIGFLTANAFNFWWLIDPGKILDNTLYFGLSARVWGLTFTIIGICALVYWLSRKLSDGRIFFALAFSSLISFLLMTRIHERYLYPFFPSATFFIAFMPGFWIIYLIVSLIHVVNLYNFFWVPDLELLKNLLIGSQLPRILSFINLAIIPLIVLLISFQKPKKI